MTIQRSTKDMPMLTTMQAPSMVKAQARRSLARRLSLIVALAVTALPLAAQAQRKSPLADAPAIRKRYELRKTRFEIGVGGASTINQDFYHTFFVGAKAAFHFTDWLSLAAFGDFAVANAATGFQGSVTDALGDAPPIDREPTPAEAKASMQKITNILGAQLEFTPFTGKYSLFGKLFASYDFYGFAGGAVISVKPTDESLPACQDGKDLSVFSCKVSGMKPGGTLGVGFHSYFTNYFALNVELRDVIAKLNPSGRDVDGVGGANNSDLTWTHTLVVGANLQFFFPTAPGVSF
jgi:outer membrane beta-barrel protein